MFNMLVLTIGIISIGLLLMDTTFKFIEKNAADKINRFFNSNLKAEERLEESNNALTIMKSTDATVNATISKVILSTAILFVYVCTWL